MVEYAVQMLELADGHFLDQRLRHGGVSPADIERIAEVLNPRWEGIEEFSSPWSLARN